MFTRRSRSTPGSVRDECVLLTDSMSWQGRPLHWPPELFTLDPRGATVRTCPHQIDITGPPRTLVFGPYITLEPGTWRAQASFTVDDAACLRRFRLDWGPLSSFASHEFVPGRPGSYTVEIDHPWSTTDATEVRLILTEGAIEGMMEFLGAIVSKTS